MCGLLPLIALASVQTSAPSLMGFTTEHSAAQLATEAKFDKSLNVSDLPVWLKRLSAKPHHVGSPYGLENAKYAESLFKSFGWDAHIERFYVLFASPKVRLLEMPGYKAKLAEPAIPQDSTSAAPGGLPPYNCYSCDGDVTGKLVYVNYGMPKDYETLEALGISVKGKIVIARYGGGWRGIKPKVAAEHGAIGCLIYSDPKDDGFYQGDVYPNGPYRNPNGVQRGSVADMPVYPGDPTTPGVGSVKGVKRLAIKDVKTITKIPCQPISYGDALPLLRTLRGPVAPDDWRGALPITYHVGVGDANIHLKLKFNWDFVEARDVVAKIKGSDLPDEWVIRGNHYDGWVMGAEDPLSGAVSLLEEAKGIGKLVKSGWKPRRTLIYCLWDGEEPGLLGSTEWCETHQDELSKKGVMYLNTDSNGRGFLGISGSHSLEKFINEVERSVVDPETHISVADRALDQKIVSASPAERKTLKAKRDMEIAALGAGSDFSGFLQHLGISSLDMGFGGEGGGGIYHSTYDSYNWYTHYGDPGFHYGVALAQIAGHTMMRFANADVLPFEFNRLTDTIDKYAQELTKLVDSMREETAEQNRLIKDGTLKATFDPLKIRVMPKAKPEVPVIDFSPMQKALARLKKVTAEYQADSKDPVPSVELDNAMMATERALLGDGLPRRTWYRHMIYAPGFYTGYGVKTIPSVREAIEQRNWTEARIEIPKVAATLDRLSDSIAKAQTLLKK